MSAVFQIQKVLRLKLLELYMGQSIQEWTKQNLWRTTLKIFENILLFVKNKKI